MTPPLLIANWKMNPARIREAVALATAVERQLATIRRLRVVLAPPHLFIADVKRVVRRAELGAQDAFWESKGAYTGEVSWEQLNNLGARYIILGHSERRIHLHETDEMINRKVRAVTGEGMTAVVCIGERERHMNGEISEAVGAQLTQALAGVKKNNLSRVVIAYEPVWAISTAPGAQADTSDNAFRTSVYIRKIIAGLYGRAASEAICMIYGGSVNAKNITGFLTEGRMQGALIGGASIDTQEFSRILDAVGYLR